jgi:SAM-dependent methyltransferase
MTLLDVGCGIGRVAFQLLDTIDTGEYVGLDVTRDSILWCQRNISTAYPRFRFIHVDAFNELYNPHGLIDAARYELPLPDRSVDRIVMASVFTHMLREEVAHYLSEFRRILRPNGRVYASFFLYSAEALRAAADLGRTQWQFAHELEEGVFGNDPTYPRGAVAYSATTMQHLIEGAGLRLLRPFIKGKWSGLYGVDGEDGQDAAVLTV